MKKIKDSKMQKALQKQYVDEMGISANFCKNLVELNDVFDDIRKRISQDEQLSPKNKNDLIVASKFAQVIIGKKISKKENENV